MSKLWLLFYTPSSVKCKGSSDRFLVHTGSVHSGFAVLLRTSCYESVIMILYCINMLDMKYACCRVDMCCVGSSWIWGKWRHNALHFGLTKSRMVFVLERINELSKHEIFTFFESSWVTCVINSSKLDEKLIWLVLFQKMVELVGNFFSDLIFGW